MVKLKISLFVLGLFLGFSGITAAENQAKDQQSPPEVRSEQVNTEIKDGEPEFEMLEIVRISIVPDAAWRCEKAFDPPVLTIKAGTTVEWTNLDHETHSVISSTGNQPCYLKAKPRSDREIQASQLPYRTKFRKQFDEPGEYQYACHLPSHHMAGKIIVTP